MTKITEHLERAEHHLAAAQRELTQANENLGGENDDLISASNYAKWSAEKVTSMLAIADHAATEASPAPMLTTVPPADLSA